MRNNDEIIKTDYVSADIGGDPILVPATRITSQEDEDGQIATTSSTATANDIGRQQESTVQSSLQPSSIAPSSLQREQPQRQLQEQHESIGESTHLLPPIVPTQEEDGDVYSVEASENVAAAQEVNSIHEYITNYDSQQQEDTGNGNNAVYPDLIWSVLFWIHIAVIIYVGIRISPKGYSMIDVDFNEIHDYIAANADDVTPEDLEKMTKFVHDVQIWSSIYPIRIGLYLAIPIGFISFVFVFITTHYVIRPFTLFFVKMGLIATVFIVTCVVVAFIIDSQNAILAFLIGLFVVAGTSSLIYKLLWPKVAFAAINLQVALQAIGANKGIYIWALAFAEIQAVWVAFWFYTTIGLLHLLVQRCDDRANANREDETHFLRLLAQEQEQQVTNKEAIDAMAGNSTSCGPAGVSFVCLLISFYWTFTVIGNTVQVYVAGVIATWSFDKNTAKGCCSSAVIESMFRTLHYSFGPICFGSLFQGICKSIRSILHHHTNNGTDHNRRDRHQRHRHYVEDPGGDGFCFLCCCCRLCSLMLDGCSALLGDVLDYFTQWSYVLVGIYGYSYLDSGKRVMELFNNKGWTALITDRLVGFLLGFTVLKIGILSGLAAMVVERVVTAIYGDDGSSWLFGTIPNFQIYVFAIGFIIGIIVSSVMINVVQGAVNTLIVCWADSPSTFSSNHPSWAGKMTQEWSSAFPDVALLEEEDQQPTALVVAEQITVLHSNPYGATVL